MKLPKNKIAMFALLAIMTANLTFAATGKPYSDEWIEGRIQGALAYNTYLDSSDLEVGISKGIATLSGTVSSDTEKELAQEIAMSVDGVSSTKNNIIVNPDIAPRDRPVWLQKFSDATTTAAVKSIAFAKKA